MHVPLRTVILRRHDRSLKTRRTKVTFLVPDGAGDDDTRSCSLQLVATCVGLRCLQVLAYPPFKPFPSSSPGGGGHLGIMSPYDSAVIHQSTAWRRQLGCKYESPVLFLVDHGEAECTPLPQRWFSSCSAVEWVLCVPGTQTEMASPAPGLVAPCS